MTDYYVDEEYEEDAFDEGGDYPHLPDEHVEAEVEEKRPVEIEGRTSWIYLGVLAALFVLLVFFSWACNDRSDSPGEPPTEESLAVSSGTSVRLAIVIDGDVVTVSGSVPDDAARQQILVVTRELYGPANVIDELTVDETFTLERGAFSVTGAATFEDNRPEALRQAIASGLGLSEGEFVIDRGEVSVDAVVVQAVVSGATIAFSGSVPDEESIAELIAAGEAVWGPGSVDVTGLTVAESTWTNGTVQVTGSTTIGDARVADFPAEVQARLGALVEVDVSGLASNLTQEALAALQEEITARVLADPIRFAPLSADIAAESEAILAFVAETLNSVPEVQVEVVGHTDSAGSEQDNQVLSLQRAEAVIVRLGELGVDGARLTAIGEGESNPLVSNDTPADRERNRRIEFRLVGAG